MAELNRGLARSIRLLLSVSAMALAQVAVLSQEVAVPQPEQKPFPQFAEIFTSAPRMTVPLIEYGAAAGVAEMEPEGDLPPEAAAKEILETVPGVRVSEDPAGLQPSIYMRGEGAGAGRGTVGIKVLLDGIPLNDPSGFAPDLYDVEWPAVERAEILRGSLSGLYGGASGNGVINIDSDIGEGPRSYRSSFTAGSDGFWSARAEAGERDGMLRNRLSVSRFFDRGYRDHSSSWGTNFYGKWRMDLDPFGSHLTGVVSALGYSGQDAGGLSSAELDGDRRGANPYAENYEAYSCTRRVTAGFITKMAMSPEKDFTASIYYRKTRSRESVPSFVEHDDYDSTGASVQYNFKSIRGYTRHFFSSGFDTDWQFLGDYRKPNLGGAQEGPGRLADQELNQYSLGVFAVERIQRGPWGLLVGLRRDRVDNSLKDKLRLGGLNLSGDMDFTKTTGKVEVTYIYSPSSSLFASWGDGFTPPSTRELLANPFRTGGFNWRLRPSISRGWEIGSRGFLWDRVRYDATLYYTDYHDETERYAVAGRPMETFSRNAGSARRYGLEASLGWRPLDRLTLRASYTYCDSKFSDYAPQPGGEDCSGNRVPDSPRHQLRADAAYDFGHGLAAGLTVELQTRAYVDASNETWAGGYTLVNPRLSYDWSLGRSSGDLFLQVRNLFGKKHIAFTEPDAEGRVYYPAPGREIFLGVRVRFGQRR